MLALLSDLNQRCDWCADVHSDIIILTITFFIYLCKKMVKTF